MLLDIRLVDTFTMSTYSRKKRRSFDPSLAPMEILDLSSPLLRLAWALTAQTYVKFFTGEFPHQLKSTFRKQDIVAEMASLLELFCTKEKGSRRLLRR